MTKSIQTSPNGIPPWLLLILLLIWMSWSGCKTRTVVISADQMETFLKKDQVFNAPVDGVFMGNAKYQRYRRAVADKILQEQGK